MIFAGVAESGSPYPSTSLAMPSPGQRNWPNSPSVQGPSLWLLHSNMIFAGVAESGSPYPSTSLAMPSPGQRNWPNSPSVQGPSPASRHGMVSSPGHPTLHSPQTQLKDEHAKASGNISLYLIYSEVGKRTYW